MFFRQMIHRCAAAVSILLFGLLPGFPLPKAAAQSYELLILDEGNSHQGIAGINDSGTAVSSVYLYLPSGARIRVLPDPQSYLGPAYSLTDITEDNKLVGFRHSCAGSSLCFAHPIDEELSCAGQLCVDLPQRGVLGAVAGECFEGPYYTYYSAAACAVINGQMRYISFLEPSSGSPYLAQRHQAATGANIGGTVVGYAYTQASTEGYTVPDDEETLRAFSFHTTTGLSDLGTLGGQDSAASAINNDGVIVGWAERASGAAEAFRRAPGSSMEGLGIPTGSGESKAEAVNDSGTIVGFAAESLDSSEDERAFVFTSSAGMRLADDALLPTFNTWTITKLLDINSRGEAAGVAKQGDVFKAAILRPLPEHSTFPQALKFNGARDRFGDFLVWRPSLGTWFALTSMVSGNEVGYESVMGAQWGLPGDIPIFYFDGDGDNAADYTVWRPSNGTWYSAKSSQDYDRTRAEIVQWGLPGDIPVVGDCDGDGKSDYAVYRRSLPAAGIIGTWYVKPSAGNPPWSMQWGLAEDYPVPADYDGDGVTDIGVFRPSVGMWFILLSSPSIGNPYIAQQWGLPGDHPMPRDADGDGKSDLVIFRPGAAAWYVCGSRTPDRCTGEFIQPIQYGLPGDYPLTANFSNGDTFPVAVWRPVDRALRTVGVWYTNIPSPAQAVRQWGLVGDIPAGVGIRDLLRLTGQE